MLKYLFVDEMEEFNWKLGKISWYPGYLREFLLKIKNLHIFHSRIPFSDKLIMVYCKYMHLFKVILHCFEFIFIVFL